jgi:cysteine desulfurase / selenocysteine lyase
MNIKDIQDIREQFPILQEKVRNKPLIYLDNAATTQKPKCVIEAMNNFYCHDNANIHRGIHTLAERATIQYENTREKVRVFINAKKTSELIFTRGTTEAINLVAQCFGRKNFKCDDEIIISTMEHHANIVPWQLISEQTGAKIRVIKIFANGELDLDHYESLINKNTKIIAITHASNTLGTINPIKKIITIAHGHNIPVLIDGAQAVQHILVDVQELDCDFYAFSAHKMYGPTGVGVLYGKEHILENIPPYQGGGDMIKRVTFAKTEFADLPQKFEAGTQNISGIIGFGAAIDFLNNIGVNNILIHENNLLVHLNKILLKNSKLKIIGNAVHKVGLVSFTMDKIHPHDIATILDTEGIAVRAGHNCTMPLMEFYNIPATTRISFGLYNTKQEIDIFAAAIDKVSRVFS